MDSVACPKCGVKAPNDAKVMFCKNGSEYMFVGEWRCQACGMLRRQELSQPSVYDRARGMWCRW